MSIADKMSELKIRHLPLRQPALVERTESIHEAVKAMRERRQGCALVCDRGELVGLFTERDLLNRVMCEGVSFSVAVEHVMTPNPEKLHTDDPVITAMRVMYDGDYRNIPLVDSHGNAAGVVTVFDLVSYIAEHFPKEALNLPPDPAILITQAEGA